MTALSVPARPQEDASLRPLPWRRMAWVTWRQHRAALAWRGRVPRRAGGAPVARRPSAAPRLRRRDRRLPSGELASPAGAVLISFNGTNGFLANGFILQAIPPLIGAFVGAPVLARELETGTFRYAWTQGFGRWRWTLAKLVPLAVVAVPPPPGCSACCCPGTTSRTSPRATRPWHFEEYDPVLPGLFDLRGIGVRRLDAGRLRDRRPGRHAHPPGRPRDRRHPGRLRRARLRGRGVPAPALPGAAGHQQPERARLRVDHQPVVDQGRQPFAFAGWPSDSLLNQFCPVSPPAGRRGLAASPRRAPSRSASPQHGYTQWTSYQPASRFWPFQWIEGGWLLALSALLIAATVGWSAAGRPDRPAPPRGNIPAVAEIEVREAVHADLPQIAAVALADRAGRGVGRRRPRVHDPSPRPRPRGRRRGRRFGRRLRRHPARSAAAPAP